MKTTIVFIPEVELNGDAKVSKQPMQAVYLLGEILLKKGFHVEITDQSEIIPLDIDNFDDINTKIIKGADVVLFSSNTL